MAGAAAVAPPAPAPHRGGGSLRLALIALWLWMARATSQGKNWARISSMVLFALATLQLIGNHGVVQVLTAVLTWLTGLPAVWLLWRPASSAFFKPRGVV
jgi:hypothetical protein